MDDGLDIETNFAQIVASTGSLPRVEPILDASYAAGKMTIEWLVTSPTPNDADLISATIINETSGDWVSVATTTQRLAGILEVDFKAPATGDVMHIYIAAYNVMSGKSSDSIHYTITQ